MDLSDMETEEDDMETATETEDEKEEGLDDSEQYVVDCCCGVKFDDGAAMIECEGCQTWAHTECLKNQVAADPSMYNYDFQHYNCMNCQQKKVIRSGQELSAEALAKAIAAAASAAQAAQEVVAGSAGAAPTAIGGSGRHRHASSSAVGPSRRVHGHGTANAASNSAAPSRTGGDEEDSDGDSQYSSRSSKDRTNELSSLLLGLANGTAGGPPSSSRGVEKFPRNGQRNRQVSRRRRPPGTWGKPVLQALKTKEVEPAGGLLSRAVSEELVDSISQFLTSNKAAGMGAALLGRNGSREGSVTASGSSPGSSAKGKGVGLNKVSGGSPASAAAMAAASAAIRARAEAQRMFGRSGLQSGLAAPKARQHPAVQRNASQQSLNKLVAAANAAATGSTQPQVSAFAKSGLLGLGDGRLSPGLLAATTSRRTGSGDIKALLGHAHSGTLPGLPPLPGTVGSGGGGASTQRPSTADLPSGLFGEDDESGPLTQMAMDHLKGDALLSLLGSRAPTPSQLFIDSLLRGGTPDIAGAFNAGMLSTGGSGQLGQGSQQAQQHSLSGHDPAALYAPFMQVGGAGGLMHGARPSASMCMGLGYCRSSYPAVGREVVV